MNQQAQIFQKYFYKTSTFHFKVFVQFGHTNKVHICVYERGNEFEENKMG